MIERFKGFSAATKTLLEGASFRAPDMLFEGPITVDLGGVHVRIFGVGPNHTLGDTAFFVVEDKRAVHGRHADVRIAGRERPVGEHREVAREPHHLRGLQPVVVVPAHGKLIDVSYVRRYRAYLGMVQSRTAAAKKAGASLETATGR